MLGTWSDDVDKSNGDVNPCIVLVQQEANIAVRASSSVCSAWCIRASHNQLKQVFGTQDEILQIHAWKFHSWSAVDLKMVRKWIYCRVLIIIGQQHFTHHAWNFASRWTRQMASSLLGGCSIGFAKCNVHLPLRCNFSYHSRHWHRHRYRFHFGAYQHHLSTEGLQKIPLEWCWISWSRSRSSKTRCIIGTLELLGQEKHM